MNEETYSQKALSAEDLHKKLTTASPLQASKLLIQEELYDQKQSIEIIDAVAEEFSKNGGAKTLVKPMLLGLFDGVLEIKQVKNLGLREKGVTPSRLVEDVYGFRYEGDTSTNKDDLVLDKQRLDVESDRNVDDKGLYSRDEMEDASAKKGYSEKHFSGKKRVKSEVEVNDQGQSRYLTTQKNAAGNTAKAYNNDHVVPLKVAFDEYGSSKALSVSDMKRATNADSNFTIISEKANKAKGKKTWDQIKQERVTLEKAVKRGDSKAAVKLKAHKNTFSDGTIKKGLVAEKSSRRAMENSLNKNVAKKIGAEAQDLGSELKGLVTGDAKFKDVMVKSEKSVVGQAVGDAGKASSKQSMNQGLGEIIILILKPVSFEIMDMFESGLIGDTGCSSKLGALSFRLKRAFKYVMVNIKKVGLKSLTNAFQDFAKMLFNAIVDMFVGIFKKSFKIIVEGFSAIVESFKVIMDKNKSAAEKGDAILKIVATTVVTFLSFAFEEQLKTFIGGIPLIGSTLAEFASVLLSSLGSVLVVYLIDQADFFSLKDEKRRQRVQEVFDERIAQIKENTDIFETVALEKLTEDKLRFRANIEKMSSSIANNKEVNQSVVDIADFMKIELKSKTSGDFMKLLESDGALMI